MQPNTLTLAVDTANNGTTSNKVFTRQDLVNNRSTYVGPGHTLASRNVLQLYRTFPKRAGTFLGSAKTAVKFTKDISVANADGSGEIQAPLIAELSLSAPVGATDAELLEIVMHLVAFARDNSVREPLHEILDV